MRHHKSKQGVALLLVLVTMAFMSVIAVEISFASRVDIRIGQNARNRLQAYYLALSAAKLSLLRLHMYKEVKNLSIGGSVPIPKEMIDKIWNLPFPQFPLPTSKAKWPGIMSATISGEGSKIPINLLDSHNYRRSSEEIKNTVVAQIKAIFTSLFEDDEFDKKYRGLDVDELINNLIDWIDPNAEKVAGGSEEGDYDDKDPRYYPRNDRIPTLTEIHMIKGWTDDLYNRVVGNFSVLNLSTAVNPNYITRQRLKAIDHELSEEDLNAIDKRRRLQPFSSLKDMETFITTDPDIRNGKKFTFGDLKESLTESIFIIEASGQVGDKALRKIRMGVRLPEDPKSVKNNGNNSNNSNGSNSSNNGGSSSSGSGATDPQVKLLAPVVLTVGETL